MRLGVRVEDGFDRRGGCASVIGWGLGDDASPSCRLRAAAGGEPGRGRPARQEGPAHRLPRRRVGRRRRAAPGGVSPGPSRARLCRRADIQIEYRHESADLQQLPAHAAELVRMDIDLLVAVTSNAAVAAKKTTSTVPIVFMGVTDPIATGLAESLARPGGNITGVTNVAAILTGKRLELLKEVLPKAHAGGRAVGSQGTGLDPAMGGQQGARRQAGAAALLDAGQHRRGLPGRVQGRREGAQPCRVGDAQPGGQLEPEADRRADRRQQACRRSAPAPTTRRTAASWPTGPATRPRAETARATSTGS